MTTPQWIQALTAKERNQYERAKAKRDKARGAYNAIRSKLKARADDRARRAKLKEAQRNE